MYEYTIEHKKCGCIAHITGISFENACKSNGYNKREWKVLCEEKAH